MSDIHKQKYTFLKRSFPAQPGRRFLCFIIDSLLLVVLTIAIFLPTFNLVMAGDAYSKNNKIIADEVNYYIDFSKETKVITYNDNNERYSDDKVIYTYISRAVCLSYEVFGNEGEPDFVLNDKVKTYGTLNKDNDNLCYFYTNYLKQEGHQSYVDMKGKDNITFFYDEFYNAFPSPSDFFDMGNEKKEAYGLPLLKNNIANQLMKNTFSEHGTMTASLYQEIAEGLQIMLTRAEDYLINSEPYHSAHYIPYCEATIRCINIMNTYLIFVILIAGLITFLLPKIIFGNEITFARRLFGLGAIDTDRKPVSWLMMAIRTTVEVAASISIVLIMYLLPPFNMDLNTLVTPFSLSTRLSLGVIVLVVIGLYLIAKTPILFSHYKQSTLDIVTKTIIVDTHYQDDDYDEEIEAKPL